VVLGGGGGGSEFTMMVTSVLWFFISDPPFVKVRMAGGVRYITGVD
jgi:hypothetical protein